MSLVARYPDPETAQDRLPIISTSPSQTYERSPGLCDLRLPPITSITDCRATWFFVSQDIDVDIGPNVGCTQI